MLRWSALHLDVVLWTTFELMHRLKNFERKIDITRLRSFSKRSVFSPRSRHVLNGPNFPLPDKQYIIFVICVNMAKNIVSVVSYLEKAFAVLSCRT